MMRLEIPGLTPDGSINPTSNAVGYVFLIVANFPDVETEYFGEYETSICKPTSDAIKEGMQLNPKDVPLFA